MARGEHPPKDEAAPPQQTDLPNREQFQFSLSELFLVITSGAVGLAGVRWLPAGLFAGLAGVFAVLSIAMLTLFAPESRVLRLAWWTLTAMYVLAAIGSVVQSWHSQ